VEYFVYCAMESYKIGCTVLLASPGLSVAPADLKRRGSCMRIFHGIGRHVSLTPLPCLRAPLTFLEHIEKPCHITWLPISHVAFFPLYA
jgi:hypothetical protein